MTCSSAAAVCKRASLRPAITTEKPAWANTRAAAKPIPCPPPVITATRSCEDFAVILERASVLPVADKSQKLFAGFFGCPEAAQHMGRNGGRMLFLYAAHHHAQVAGFNHHAHAQRLDGVLDGFGDLHGQAFLHLQAAREDVHQPGDLAQSHYFAVGNVSHVNLAEEWQQMMLAQAEHLDVLDDDHFVVGDLKQGSLKNLVRVFVVPL